MKRHSNADVAYWYTRFLDAEQDRDRLLGLLAEIEKQPPDEIPAFVRGLRAATSLPTQPRTEREVSTVTTREVTPREQVSVVQLLAGRFFHMSKRKKRLLILAFALMAVAMVSSIAAAIIIYTGSSGSVTGGKIENSTTQAALTVSPNGPIPDLKKGVQTTIPVTIQNNTATSVTPLTWTITYTTPSQPACAGSLTTGNNLPTTAVGPSGSTPATFSVMVNTNLPDSCAGVSWVGTVAGTTNP